MFEPCDRAGEAARPDPRAAAGPLTPAPMTPAERHRASILPGGADAPRAAVRARLTPAVTVVRPRSHLEALPPGLAADPDAALPSALTRALTRALTAAAAGTRCSAR